MSPSTTQYRVRPIIFSWELADQRRWLSLANAIWMASWIFYSFSSHSLCLLYRDTHPRRCCLLTPSSFVQIPKIRRAPSCGSTRRRRARGALAHASKRSFVLFPAEANGWKPGRLEQPVQVSEHQHRKPSQERTHGGCVVQWHFKKNRFESWAWSLNCSGHPPRFPESNVNCLRKRPPPAPHPGTVPPSHTHSLWLHTLCLKAILLCLRIMKILVS